MLKLIEATTVAEQDYWDYIAEWQKSAATIIPSSTDPHGRSFQQWRTDTIAMQTRATCPPGHVSADTYFLIDDANASRLLGAINIRHSLTDYLYNYGGHIGYGIRPTERRKGYARTMLTMALERCRQLKLERVLITCDKTNIASAQTIRANGGILENELLEGPKIKQRYWITL